MYGVPQKLPPKMLAIYEAKARRDEDCKPIGSFRTFAQGNNVITILLGDGWAEGHIRKDPYKAEEIRAYISARTDAHDSWKEGRG